MFLILPRVRASMSLGLVLSIAATHGAIGQRSSVKPVLHGTEWVAIGGKPLVATAGATIFTKGGNAVDATCAMLAAACTMWDTLSWGGETQALIYNPNTRKVIGVNALGMAPTGATVEFYRRRRMAYPPEYGPLASLTPGTPGGLMMMLAEFGTMSLAEVLAPAIKMAEGYPIEQQSAAAIERHRVRLMEWPYSSRVFLTRNDEEHPGRWVGPKAGDIFRQPDLAATLRKLVEAERTARSSGNCAKHAGTGRIVHVEGS
jgi:gamma-glutamyltranspeptidase/glutathione hydrolase